MTFRAPTVLPPTIFPTPLMATPCAFPSAAEEDHQRVAFIGVERLVIAGWQIEIHADRQAGVTMRRIQNALWRWTQLR